MRDFSNEDMIEYLKSFFMRTWEKYLMKTLKMFQMRTWEIFWWEYDRVFKVIFLWRQKVFVRLNKRVFQVIFNEDMREFSNEDMHERFSL